MGGSAVDVADGADDVIWLRLAQRGDHRAFGVLVARHQSLLLSVCRRITGDEDDALDARQEALVAAWRGLARFDGRSRFSTWLYRIAVNEAIDQRARSRRAPLPVAEVPERSGGGEQDQVLDRMVIAAALAAMSPVFRSAVVLRDVFDLTYEDTAAVLGIKVDTVKSRLSRGRRALRPALTRAA